MNHFNIYVFKCFTLQHLNHKKIFFSFIKFYPSCPLLKEWTCVHSVTIEFKHVRIFKKMEKATYNAYQKNGKGYIVKKVQIY